MSHTTSAYHDVAGVTVGAVTVSADKQYRWQNVRIHFADGGTHDITAFLMPGATQFPLVLRNPPIAGDKPLDTGFKSLADAVASNNAQGAVPAYINPATLKPWQARGGDYDPNPWDNDGNDRMFGDFP